MRLLLERFTCDAAGCDNHLDMPYLGQGRSNKLPEGWIGMAGSKWGGIYCGLSCLEAEIKRVNERDKASN